MRLITQHSYGSEIPAYYNLQAPLRLVPRVAVIGSIDFNSVIVHLSLKKFALNLPVLDPFHVYQDH